MGWPQWVLAVALAFEVLASLLLDGRPRLPIDFGRKALEILVLALLLHAGGFWT